MFGEARDASRDILKQDVSCTGESDLRDSLLTCLGLIMPQLHAIAHLLVFPPCTNSLTAKFSIPTSLSFSTTVPTLLSFPSMLVYHWHLVFNATLSSIIRFTKAISPPGVTISTSAPVQAEWGGRDLASAEARSSVVEA